MKITAMQEYGLRCMLQLVSHKSQSPLTVREIAKSERLTAVYVEKILVSLRRSGLVKSLRGVNGGYVLCLPPKDISVAAVLTALGQVDLGKDLCQRFTGTSSECVHNGDCGIRPIWAMLTRYIYGFLSKVSLVQLIQKEELVVKEINRLQSETTFSIKE